MRKRFEQARELDAVQISEVKLDSKSRHELPQLLAGLQYIFITPVLNEEVFKILEETILSGKKSTGRIGMSLWEILVIGTMRLNLDIDYDMLQDMVNQHQAVRGILGVRTNAVFGVAKYYELQTVKDNVSLLSEECLQEISAVVVKAGHQLKKKEEVEEIELVLKTDSYPVESNIHFPTDISLLWDSGRKCIDVIRSGKREVGMNGWRKSNDWRKRLKKAYRNIANIHQKKGNGYQERLKNSAKVYLEVAMEINQKVVISIEELRTSSHILSLVIREELKYYQEMLDKHIDLVYRRIVKGEKIPHNEKIFSIFEPHVEWIQKGKANNKIELGHNALVTTDQYQFILDHKVMIKETDSHQPIELLSRLKKRYNNGYKLKSMSFDRGFHSKLSKAALEKEVEQVVMPSKGKQSKEAQEESNKKAYITLRNKHCAVESNINELEHAGVNKVPDKGLEGFKRYVALGVLAYNIRRLGKIVIAENLLSTLVAIKKAA